MDGAIVDVVHRHHRRRGARRLLDFLRQAGGRFGGEGVAHFGVARGDGAGEQ